MTNLPWLIQASGPGPARRRAGRTEQAARDLAVLAERLARQDLHLVVEDAVDIAFELGPRHLPAGSVDARGSDALAVALDDPTGVLITAGGIYIGRGVARDPRWDELAELGRSRGTLGSSALSGRYYGLSVDGPHAGHFRDGIAEEFVAVEVELVYGDGSVARIDRTTLDHLVRVGDRTIRCRSLIDAVRWTEALPVQATSAVYAADELAAVLAEADRLVPPALVPNGEPWQGA